ncbi:FAD-dependent oxidoreductase, partial [uncultured Boseongicola sp.]|uniref:FAD-dependent oxidoreductase n=1 Tax=uncultured Boseongicola sp. TaxID=1648499 RepID=UPI0026033EDD
TFSELRDRHEAVLIATGVYGARDLSVPGANLNGTIPALDYLIASNKKGFGDEVPDYDSGLLNAKGKRVVVIGGGDTAMDCVRTAVRQEAISVTCLYRRNRANMPGSQREVGHAEAEGVVFEWLASPLAIEGLRKVTSVRAERMRLGAPEAGGRQRIERIPDSEFNIDADLVITALGFDPEDLPKLFHEPILGVSRGGTLAVDPQSAMTSMSGVFAAGDIVRGASLVVWAVRDGREVTRSIDSYLTVHKSAAQAEAS